MNAAAVDPKRTLLLTVGGFLVMLAGALAYIIDPGLIYQAVFAVGLAVMAFGYAVQYLAASQLSREEAELEEDEAVNGFFYILDEDYSAPAGDATIEDLTRR